MFHEWTTWMSATDFENKIHQTAVLQFSTDWVKITSKAVAEWKNWCQSLNFLTSTMYQNHLLQKHTRSAG